MPRLFDADALDKAFTELRFNADGGLAHWGDRKDWCLHGSEIEKLIADAPTVDAEPVVRCKDCKYYYADPWGWGNCVFEGGVSRRTKETDFCSWGERRKDAKTETDRNGFDKQDDLFPQGR